MSNGMQLPQGWTTCKLGDLLKPTINADPKTYDRETFRYVDIQAIDNNTHQIVAAKELSVDKAPSRARRIVHSGDIIISLVRPYLKNTALVPFHLHEQWVSTAFCVCRTHSLVTGKFLFYLFISDEFVHRIPTYGDSPPAGHPDDLMAMSVALPPEAEQQRIADRVEELFANLDAGVSVLVRVQKKLKRYRAALLHAAVTGRLTADWRAKHGDGGESGKQLLERILVARRQDWEQHTLAEYEVNGRTPTKNWRDRYPEPSLPDTSSLAELPDSWVWASAAQLCSSIQNGNTPEAPMMSAGYGEVPFLKVYNLTKNGSLNFEKDPTYISMKTHSELLKRSICRPGDVLMNIVGPPLGKVSIVPDTHPEWNINQAIVAYRCLEGFSNRLLCSLLLTESVLRPLLNTSKATAGQFNISVNSSRSVAIPVPPVAEQEVLLGVLSEKVSNIESMEAEVDRGLRRAARLRQAILKAAFEGKLVPQNPNDEPASELLARIQAEADAGANSATKRAPSKRKTTKRKTNKKATT
ncbi:restriction endonuclease subunit S [Pirellulaceae bacterium SH501]